jgi:internalin A
LYIEISNTNLGNSDPIIPTDVYYLTNLQELSIPHNGIKSLSPDVAWLSNLTIADLSHNALSELPPEIGKRKGG